MLRRIVIVLLVASVFAATGVPADAAIPFPAKADARIVIAQDQQRMLIYERGKLIKTFPISTGLPTARESSTPIWTGPIADYWGTFSSFGTTQDDGYWLFTDRLPDGRWNGDILIHGAPYLLGPGGEKVYDTGGIGVAPSSHGCIRMLPEDMAWFRGWDPQGVTVDIRAPRRSGTHREQADPRRVAPGDPLTGPPEARRPCLARLRRMRRSTR